MNKEKIAIFKNKEDLIYSMSDDKIINITGMTGSGKSTLGKEIAIQKGYELLNFDWIFGYGYDKDKISCEIKKVMNELQNKYPETKEEGFFRWKNNKKEDETIKKRYKQYVSKFYAYIINNIKTNLIIEGIQFLDDINVKDLKGTLIIKRTSLLNCYKRAFKRDVSECYKNYKKGNIKRKNLMDMIIERTKIPISAYQKTNHYINEIIDKGNKI